MLIQVLEHLLLLVDPKGKLDPDIYQAMYLTFLAIGRTKVVDDEVLLSEELNDRLNSALRCFLAIKNESSLR